MNITDNQSSVMRYPSLAHRADHPGAGAGSRTCRSPAATATACRIETDLLFAYTRGVRSVLCLTGDSVPVGDHKDAKSVFDLESVQLLNMIRDDGGGQGPRRQRDERPGEVLQGRHRHPRGRPDRAPDASSSRRRSRPARSGSRPRRSTTWTTSRVHEDGPPVPDQDAGGPRAAHHPPAWPST